MYSRKLRQIILATVFVVFSGPTGPGWAGEADFRQWIHDFYPDAEKEGIRPAILEAAFAGVVAPEQQVLEKARFQPEFTTEIWDYLDSRVNPLAIDKGHKMSRFYARTLEAVENRFGVEQAVLLAIWSMESNYGAILEKPEKLFYVPLALATLAYGDAKRRKFARNQLIATLKILQAGDVDRSQLIGSWAGAMGHTQFIPTSYLAYGVDMDGNGRRDIWNSVPDALATAANLLQKNGWRTGTTWGYEVVLPMNGERFKDKTKSLAEWAALGFDRPAGSEPYPRTDDKAVLKLLAGPRGPVFLMTKNFFVLKRYNNSDSYALAVSLLADRLTGKGGVMQSWPRPAGSLTAEEKIELQERLHERGYYSGEIDGHLGQGTKTAISSFQAEAGLVDDGLPSQSLLQALRR
jgi:membrane-bound lytic murein transglycosylase B